MSIKTSAQLQLTKPQGPFRIAQVTVPALFPDQVLIRPQIIALNPIDVKQRDTGLGITSYPHVLGIEGAGVIDSVGSEVSDLKPGDEVLAWMGSAALPVKPWGGAFQELVAVERKFVGLKPRNVGWEEAASLPIAFVTAVVGIVESLKIPLPFLPEISSTTAERHLPASVLILGGSSAVGVAAIQLLRKAHPTLPIYTTCSTKHHTHLLDLGATYVFDYKTVNVVSAIKAESQRHAAGAGGIDVILDCVSAAVSQGDIFDVFGPVRSKRYAAVTTGVHVPVPEGVHKVNVGAWSMVEMPGGEGLIMALTRLVEDGTYGVPLPVRVVGHGLSELAASLDEVERVSGEKLVIKMSSP